jgi:outer membrane lipoprotein-sorting protein
MTAVEGRARGDQVKGTMVITVTDKSGRKRQRAVRTRSMLFDGGTKQLMIFQSPADVKGTGLLSTDYDDGAKDDDQWLYLPSLHKSTRISSGDKSGSFMGTDFTYSDMTRADPAHYDYKVLEQSTQAAGDDCWLVEALPKTDKVRKETGYLKTHIWVSKTKLIPLQAKMWVKAGKKIKQVRFDDIKDVGGILVPHTLKARTKRGKTVESTTVLQFTELSHGNADVSDTDFNQRALEKGL